MQDTRDKQKTKSKFQKIVAKTNFLQVAQALKKQLPLQVRKILQKHYEK